MYISSHEPLRDHLLNKETLTSLVELPLSGFTGAVVQICAFTFTNKNSLTYQGGFIQLTKFKGAEAMPVKALEAVANQQCGFFHRASARDFKKVPGKPLAYWLSDNARNCFTKVPALSDQGVTRKGMVTARNEVYVRLWHEVGSNKCAFDKIHCRGEAKSSGNKWFSYIKGGDFWKWYGNNSYVVNWENDGQLLQTARHPTEDRVWATNFNLDYIFRPNVNWSDVTSGKFSARRCEGGSLFDATGLSCFSKQVPDEYILGFLNSAVSAAFLEVLNPTLHYQAGNIADLPLHDSNCFSDEALAAVATAIDIARADWDNFETSWDFRDQPLLRPGLKGATLEASWRNWEAQSTAAIRRMQKLETENNRLFIAAYGLEGELQPEVPEDQITLFCNPASRYKKKARKKKKAEDDSSNDTEGEGEAVTAYTPEERYKFFIADTMREFISYAIGCMMGRYSLDAEGLILANAGDTVETYAAKIASLKISTFSIQNSTFHPDTDGILPMLDGEWFEDDLVARTKEFLRATFDDATLADNLRFIEQSLGRELRDYFLTDFYKDHLQTYKNRPIYWLFSSGKQKAFQCLVYLHRYTPATLARIRTEYAIPLQGKLAARITRLEEEVTQTSSSAARKKLQTDLDKYKKQLVELLAFDEQLRSYADQAITLDLDDGVKTNYAKFGSLVAESKKVCGTIED
jgi:hypothetical protein